MPIGDGNGPRAPFQAAATKLVWYAADATGCDKLEKLRRWFDVLLEKSPLYGYFPKPEKCILVVKEERMQEARKIFRGSKVHVKAEGSKDTGVEINCEGTRHLGAVVGSSTFKQSYITQKIEKWVLAVKKLAGVVTTQPHAAYAAFTHSLQGQWTFLCRAVPEVGHLFAPLEDAIRHDLIRAFLKRQDNNLERDMLSRPARMGGMGIFNPTEECVIAITNSAYISRPLVRLIQKQAFEFSPRELADEMKSLRAEVDKAMDERFKTKLTRILENAPNELKEAVRASSEKGASSWVTACPSYDYGTVLHKGEFVDACSIRLSQICL